MKHSSSLQLLISLIVIFCGDDGSLAQTIDKSQDFKLKATITELGTKGTADSLTHYEADKAVQFYLVKNYIEAEKHFRAALDLAKRDGKTSQENHATLECNLGSVLRDEGKYDESLKHFELAVSIARQHLKGESAVFKVIGAQYSSLLRRMNRTIDADMIVEAAKIGFVSANAKETAKLFDSDEFLVPNKTKASPVPIQKLELVEHTFSFTPSATSDEQMPQIVKQQCARVSGKLSFRVQSDFHPLELTVQAIPNSPFVISNGWLVETFNSPKWAHPRTHQITIPTPCFVQAFSYSETCQYSGKMVNTGITFGVPDDAPQDAPFYAGYRTGIGTETLRWE